MICMPQPANTKTEQSPVVEQSDPSTTASPTVRGGSSDVDTQLTSLSLLKRMLLLAGAGVCFVLGVLGALLPVLPATPFLLLTSYLLVRSSPRLNQRLLRSRMFGPILTDWQIHGGVKPHVKVKAIVIVLIAVGLTIWAAGYSPIPSIAVTALAAVGITVIVRVPTVNRRS